MNEIFTKRLTELRGDKSQSEIAKIFSVKQNTISRWENGDREPDYTTLTEIAKYFEVSTDYLLGLTDIPDPY